jgi:proteasome assembly chaperone 3
MVWQKDRESTTNKTFGQDSRNFSDLSSEHADGSARLYLRRCLFLVTSGRKAQGQKQTERQTDQTHTKTTYLSHRSLSRTHAHASIMQTQSQPTPTPTTTQPNLTPSTFPAPSKTRSSNFANVQTQVTALNFSDKLVLTITQSGRLNHWVHVPLSGGRPLDNGFLNPSSETDVDASLLPFAHLTATTVFGGTRGEFEVLGQTLATTVATALLMRNPDEQRTVVVGLGLERADQGKQAFDELVGLCLECL